MRAIAQCDEKLTGNGISYPNGLYYYWPWNIKTLLKEMNLNNIQKTLCSWQIANNLTNFRQEAVLAVSSHLIPDSLYKKRLSFDFIQCNHLQNSYSLQTTNQIQSLILCSKIKMFIPEQFATELQHALSREAI